MDSPALRLHAIRIFVRDLEESLHFYQHLLGFEVVFDVRLQSGDRWIGVAPPDGSTLLAISAPRPGSYDEKLIGRSTGIVFITENVIAKTAEWTKRGVHFFYYPRLRRAVYQHTGREGTSTSDDIWGGVFTEFKDLDGNRFSLVGFDEVSRQIDQQRRDAAARLEAERHAAHELEIAKQVQARLFPQTPPPIASLEYAGSCLQARQVGGDYFDFIELGAERFALIAGDVAGKGIAAALLMANLQASLRIHCAAGNGCMQTMLRSVNQVFHRNTTPGAYATLFFAEYDGHQRRLRYVNCGHLPGMLLHPGGEFERLAATATVLGAFPDWDCNVEERRLAPGDLLALYTDGVTETFDASYDEFGEPRLLDGLKRRRHSPVQNIIDGVFADVQTFGAGEQFDDITLIVARCR